MSGDISAGTTAEVATALRGLLSEVAEPDSELVVSAASRHRIEGAAIALDGVVESASANDG